MNRNRIRRFSLFTSVVCLASFAAGCGGSGTAGSNQAPAQVAEKPPEPVTLQLFGRTPIPEADFQKFYVQPIKAKFPHITIEKTDSSKDLTIPSLVASGQIPDLIWDGLTNILESTILDLPSDLNVLAQKYKYDFNRFEPSIVNSIKTVSTKGETLFFPVDVVAFATHYNKDIFDKFGVPYPQDNMTWEDMIELSKRLSRQDGSVQYQGMNMAYMNRLPAQMSLAHVDPKTNKVLIQGDGWRQLFELGRSIWYNPGGAAPKIMNGRAQFLTERTLAMFPDIFLLGNADLDKATNAGLNWDVVAYPSVKGKPGIIPGGFIDGFTIPKGSKHPEEAFQVLMYLASDEVQLAQTKAGRMTVLKNAEIAGHTYEDNPLAKTRNIAPILKQKPAESYVMTPYDRIAYTSYNKFFVNYSAGKFDLNSALSQAEEEANKAIAAELGNNK